MSLRLKNILSCSRFFYRNRLTCSRWHFLNPPGHALVHWHLEFCAPWYLKIVHHSRIRRYYSHIASSGPTTFPAHVPRAAENPLPDQHPSRSRDASGERPGEAASRSRVAVAGHLWRWLIPLPKSLIFRTLSLGAKRGRKFQAVAAPLESGVTLLLAVKGPFDSRVHRFHFLE